MAEALAIAGKWAIFIFLLLRRSSTQSAGVIAVVQITEDVVTKCYKYRAAYKNASKDMIRLSAQVSGLQGVLLDVHKLIVAEEAQRFSRLPTLMTALGISHDDQSQGEHSEVIKSGDETRPGYELTESMPSERTGLLKRLSKKFKRKGRKNMIDTQCEHTSGTPSPTVTMTDSLTAEGGNTARNASENKVDHKGLPPVLRDCHAELQSLSKKLETKNSNVSRKEAVLYAFRKEEVDKSLANLQRFQRQLTVALSLDHTYVQLSILHCQCPLIMLADVCRSKQMTTSVVKISTRGWRLLITSRNSGMPPRSGRDTQAHGFCGEKVFLNGKPTPSRSYGFTAKVCIPTCLRIAVNKHTAGAGKTVLWYTIQKSSNI
jgi:hypothetical protein